MNTNALFAEYGERLDRIKRKINTLIGSLPVTVTEPELDSLLQQIRATVTEPELDSLLQQIRATEVWIKQNEWYVSRDDGLTGIAFFNTQAEADRWYAENQQLFPGFRVCRRQEVTK